MQAGDPLLSQQTLRSLSDRSYEKRKAGAQDVDALIQHLTKEGRGEDIQRLLNLLSDEFTQSTNIYYRKGGLAALSAAAHAVGRDLERYLPVLVAPVLKCFEDVDARVRYYACESMFNIAKVARHFILRYFNSIFESICRLVADMDTEVKMGAGVLNRKMKDIVTECEAFDVESFVPQLQLHIASTNAHVKELIVGWIVTLDSVPDIDMLDYLPRLLDGMLAMLSDSNKEVKKVGAAAARGLGVSVLCCVAGWLAVCVCVFLRLPPPPLFALANAAVGLHMQQVYAALTDFLKQISEVGRSP